MSKKLYVIETCEDCPRYKHNHYPEIMETLDWCNKYDREIKELKTIPKWCKLSNVN